MSQIPLWDKLINVNLTRDDGSTAFIRCPPTGRKPTIRLNGTILSTEQLQSIVLRITNFVSDVPLSEYAPRWDDPKGGSAVIEAGYAGDMKVAFEGEITNSYQETPGPDGVTSFEVMVGYLSKWATIIGRFRYDLGTPLIDVLRDAAEKLDLKLLYYADPTLTLPARVDHYGLVKELFVTLKKMFAEPKPWGDWSGLTIRPDGGTLVVSNKDIGTGIVYKLNYVSMVNRSAIGFSVQAPWVPSIRVDDSIELDPAYFAQTFGGAQAQPGTTFRIYRIEFDFCTTDSTNMMTLLTQSEAEIPVVHELSIPRHYAGPE
jgi:hypothetical protein